MPRPKIRTIDAPWDQDEEPDWKSMTKADAIREASKLLGGERSAIKVIRFLEQRNLQVTSPQAVKVLGELYKQREQPPHPDNLANSVRAVIAVQKYASEHGGVDALAKKLEEAESLVAFANTIGGLEVVRAIVQQLEAAD
jgi:ribosomal protein S19E (S16A)